VRSQKTFKKNRAWPLFLETPLTLGPGSHLASFDRPLRARIPAGLMNSTEVTPFSLDMKLNGSGGLLIAPVGMQTQVVIDSPWADPSFQGAFLPVEREVAPVSSPPWPSSCSPRAG